MLRLLQPALVSCVRQAWNVVVMVYKNVGTAGGIDKMIANV